MPLSAVWTAPHEYVEGELLTKVLMNAGQENILYLASRPDGFAEAVGSGATSTSTTFVQLATPTVTVTPRITGNLLIIGSICLSSSVAGDLMGAHFDVNGTNLTGTNVIANVANIAIAETLVAVFAVTANTAYTIKWEFNRASGTGTVTAVTNKFNTIYAIEVG